MKVIAFTPEQYDELSLIADTLDEQENNSPISRRLYAVLARGMIYQDASDPLPIPALILIDKPC